MKLHTDPTEAVLTLLGETESTPSRKLAILRSMLRGDDGGALHAVTLTYSATMPVAAYLVMSTTFSGRSSVVFDPGDSDIEREGFYARASDLFHANSVDFEEAADQLGEAGRLLAVKAIEAGINTFQAVENMPMGSSCRAVFTGTFLDWANLVRAHANVSKASHPTARAFVLDVWGDIKTRMPLLVEAYNERAPS